VTSSGHCGQAFAIPDAAIRMGSITAVITAGDLPSLPMLEEIRTSDPWVSADTHAHTIREMAEKAIVAIKEHPLNK